MNDKPPKRIHLLQYSLLALPLAFAGLPLYIHAPDFYTRELGMNIGLIGAILITIRLFDAIQDPIIGYISDRFTAQRFTIIASGALCMTLGMGMVFYGPQGSVPMPYWFSVAMILSTTGFSILAINLNMIGGFWQEDKDERTRISAWREAFTLLGLLMAAALPAFLQNQYSAEKAYAFLFWFFAGLMGIAFILFSVFMRKTLHDHTLSKTKTNKGFSFLKILVGPDRKFFAICLLTHIAASIPGVLVLFFIQDYLQAGQYAGLFLFLYFMAGAVLMPIWVKAAEKYGKEQSWLFSMILAVITFIGAFFLQEGDIVPYAIICVLSGMALGADLALPPSILADRVTKQNTQNEGTQYYALLAFIPKASIALASGGAFLTLEILNFNPGTNNSTQALDGVLILYALVPCCIKLLAAILLWHTLKTEGENYAYLERSSTHGTTRIS